MELLINELCTGHSIVFNIFIALMHLIYLILSAESAGARKILNRGNAVVLIDKNWRTELSGAMGLCKQVKFMFYYSKLCRKEKTIFTGSNIDIQPGDRY